jgi:hypothetical protein
MPPVMTSSLASWRRMSRIDTCAVLAGAIRSNRAADYS